MTWFAVDDRFHSHPKVSRLRRDQAYPAALALWTLAGSWACSQEGARWTGRVPLYVLDDFRVPGADAAVAALVEVGLWERDGESVLFHDWDRWNGAGAHEHRSREQAAERKRAQRLRDCKAGRHDRHCPTTDLDGQPWQCPERTRKMRVTAGHVT